MSRAGIVVCLVPAVASADGIAHPEELTLGELGRVQEATELQLSAMPSQTRDGWQQRYAVEYGVTSRLQLGVEGQWIQDGERGLELAALVAPWRGDHVAVALGIEVSTEGEVEPIASMLVGGARWGANVSGGSTIGGEWHAGAALFARVSRFTPIVEFGAGPEYAGRAGVAAELGDFELMVAGGYGGVVGPSAHLLASWEIELGGEDDDDRAGDERVAVAP